MAAIAFHAFTDRDPHNTDHHVTSPELLTDYNAAAKLRSCLGRQIVHVKLTPEEIIQLFISQLDLPEHYAKLLTSLEASAAKSGED